MPAQRYHLSRTRRLTGWAIIIAIAASAFAIGKVPDTIDNDPGSILILSVAGLCCAIATIFYFRQKPSPRDIGLSRFSSLRSHIANYFSPRRSWYGYILRVGIIWFGGLKFTQTLVFAMYDDLPLSAERLIRLGTGAAVAGVLCGSFHYGLLNIALAQRRER